MYSGSHTRIMIYFPSHVDILMYSTSHSIQFYIQIQFLRCTLHITEAFWCMLLLTNEFWCTLLLTQTFWCTPLFTQAFGCTPVLIQAFWCTYLLTHALWCISLFILGFWCTPSSQTVSDVLLAQGFDVLSFSHIDFDIQYSQSHTKILMYPCCHITSP